MICRRVRTAHAPARRYLAGDCFQPNVFVIGSITNLDQAVPDPGTTGMAEVFQADVREAVVNHLGGRTSASPCG
jgi:hypothetical protein